MSILFYEILKVMHRTEALYLATPIESTVKSTLEVVLKNNLIIS